MKTNLDFNICFKCMILHMPIFLLFSFIIAPYFIDCISEQDLDEMNIEIIRNTLYKVKHNYCDFHKDNFGREFYTTFFIFAYLLPLSTIAVLSMGIWRHMRKNVMTSQRESLRRQAKAERHLVVIVAVFAVCWMPMQFMLLLFYWGYLKYTHAYGIFLVLSQSLAYLNSCLNPIIYNLASKEFRQHFNEILCCVYRKCRNS